MGANTSTVRLFLIGFELVSLRTSDSRRPIMGDFRASIKIDMTLIGKPFKTDMWINYFPNDDGIDSRVADWFRECWDQAKTDYDLRMHEADRTNREAAQKQKDLETLALLKAKYEPPL
jgi:hypothetical protein